MNEGILFVGPSEYAASMRLLGFACRPAEGAEEAARIVRDELEEGRSLVFVSRDVWKGEGWDRVTVLPGMGEREEEDALRSMIRQALGTEQIHTL